MSLRRYILLAFVCLSALVASAGQSADTLTVYFRQGETTIDMTYMGNDTTAVKVREILNNQNNSPLSSLIIQGTASPEGSTALNERLSRGRAMTIAQYFNIPDTLVCASFTAQDWKGLQSRVKDDPNVPYKTEVEQVLSDIVSSANKACPIDVLRNMHGGRPCQYLYANHFPYLRRSQIVFIAKDVQKQDTLTSSDVIVESPIANNVNTFDTIAVCEDVPAPVVEEITPEVSKAYIFGLKTNLLYDAALIPNIGIEFPIGPHFSVGAN